MISGDSNIILIGMPGAGKSTVGAVLAARLSRPFLDTDQLIQEAEGRTLQEIVDLQGPRALRTIEEQILLGLHLENHVVATGGSAVYGRAAMDHLQAMGVIVFLAVQLSLLAARLTDVETRGLARRPGQSLADLFAERSGLYRKYADLVIRCADLSPEQVSAKIVAELKTSRERSSLPPI